MGISNVSHIKIYFLFPVGTKSKIADSLTQVHKKCNKKIIFNEKKFLNKEFSFSNLFLLIFIFITNNLIPFQNFLSRRKFSVQLISFASIHLFSISSILIKLLFNLLFFGDIKKFFCLSVVNQDSRYFSL